MQYLEVPYALRSCPSIGHSTASEHDLLFSSGGGIGGLSLALVLRKYAPKFKFTIHLYETRPTFVEIGAGITISRRSQSILALLGLKDTFKNKTTSNPLTLRKSDTKDPFSFCENANPRKYYRDYFSVFSTNVLPGRSIQRASAGRNARIAH